MAKENGIKNVLVSAGYINPEPLKKLIPYIDAANIDLKSFDNELYKKLNHATLDPVLHTLKTLKEGGVWLEITNLLIPTLNDSEEKLHEMCEWLTQNGFSDTPLHFSRYFPMYKMRDIPSTPTDTLLKAAEVAQKAGIKYVYVGNAPEIDGENTYCPSCGSLLIEREGFSVENNILISGECPKCHKVIDGVWK